MKEADKIDDNAKKPYAEIKLLVAKGNSLGQGAKEKYKLIGNLQAVFEKLRGEHKKNKKRKNELINM